MVLSNHRKCDNKCRYVFSFEWIPGRLSISKGIGPQQRKIQHCSFLYPSISEVFYLIPIRDSNLFYFIAHSSFILMLLRIYPTRLTPVYGIILGFFATMMVYLGSGPGWANVNAEAEMCRSNWWKNLLYINNYFPDDTVRTNHLFD